MSPTARSAATTPRTEHGGRFRWLFRDIDARAAASFGYLDAKIDPVAAYDDEAHTIAYTAHVEEGKPYRLGAMVITGLSTAAERRLRDQWPIPAGELFDKTLYEDFLSKLQTKPAQVFGDLPVHYDEVGHWLQPDQSKSTVDVLLDFK